MNKHSFLVNIDAETFRQYKEIVGYGNITKSLEDHMTNTIAVKTGDAKKINLNILNLEITRLQKDLTKIQAELNKKVQIRDDIEKNKLEEEKAKLEEEAKAIEEAEKCINCGNTIKSKYVNFPRGKVCHACFGTASGEQAKQWS